MKRYLWMGFTLFVIYTAIFSLPAANLFHAFFHGFRTGVVTTTGYTLMFAIMYMLIGIGVILVGNLLLTLVINKLSQDKRPFLRMWGTSTLIFATYLFIDLYIVSLIPGTITIFG